MTDLSLRLKPYLQPFEVTLALRELNALTSDEPLDTLPAIVNLKNVTESQAEQLLRRLAYFDEATLNAERVLTQQSLREISQTADPSISKKVPRSRRLRFGAHDVHEYRGKFFPQLVRSLINQVNLPPGSVVCDPMSGSGTTAMEATDLGMKFIGTDLNPLSIALTKTKARLASGLTPNEVALAKEFLSDELFKSMDISISECLDAKTLEYLNLWFTPEVLESVVKIRESIDNSNLPDRLSSMFNVVLSNIIRKVSHQVEDDLRVRKGFSTHSRDSVFDEFVEESQRQIGLLERINRAFDEYSDLSTYTSVQIRKGDARYVSKIFPEHIGQVDCIITSPPYATALPYLDTDRLSLMTLGLIEKAELKPLELQMIGTREISEKQRREWWSDYESNRHLLPQSVQNLISSIAEINHGEGIGFRRRNLPALLGKYFLDMRLNLESAREMLKPGAFAFYVVGSNSTKLDGEKIIIETDRLLLEIATAIGFEEVDFLNMDLLASRDVFKENRGSSESLLTLRKPTHG